MYQPSEHILTRFVPLCRNYDQGNLHESNYVLVNNTLAALAFIANASTCFVVLVCLSQIVIYNSFTQLTLLSVNRVMLTKESNSILL